MAVALMAALCLAAPALSTRAAADDAPQRIVSLTPAVTEIVFALGLGDRLVGVSSYCDHPPAAKEIEKVGTFVTPAIERIVATRPDLVIAEPNVGNRNPVESLRELGVAVLIVDPDTIAQAKQTFVDIATRLGVPERGAALAAKVDADIAAVVGRLGDVPLRRTLFVVGRRPLIVAGSGTLQDELLQLARGSNVGADGGPGWPHLSIEHVVAAAPDVIIDASMGNEDGAEEAVTFWGHFASIPAVRNQRVAVYGAGEVFRPGPRIGAALEGVARLVHPERFAPATGSGD
jgi:iron complex transport system substrate-binding protein